MTSLLVCDEEANQEAVWRPAWHVWFDVHIKIMISLNYFSDTAWPVFSKLHVEPSVEWGIESLFQCSISIDQDSHNACHT